MIKALLCFFLLTGIPVLTLATHMRSGQILVNQVAPGSKTVRITVQVYTNTINTNVQFGGEDDYLHFGDGNSILVPETQNIIRLDLNPDGSVASASFVIDHTYETLGFYTVSYSEPNRNANVFNYSGSVNTRFYIESRFLLMADKAYKSPTPILPPIFHGFVNDDFSASVAAVDSNQFALFYSLEVPLMAKNTHVADYQLPGPNVFLYPLTGLLKWDCKFKAQNVVGEFLFALKVLQYDTTDVIWQNVGYMYRDFQIIVSESGTTNGFLRDNLDLDENLIKVPENTSKTLKVFAYHNANEQVRFSISTELPDEYFTFETFDSLHMGQNISVGALKLVHTLPMARRTPYIIAIRSSFSNDTRTYYKDINYGLVTKDFVPAFGPISAVEKQEAIIQLSPNPFRDFVTMHSSSKLSLAIRIFNALGQVALLVRENSQNEYDLSSLPSGIYFIQGVSPDGKVVLNSRMIKE